MKFLQLTILIVALSSGANAFNWPWTKTVKVIDRPAVENFNTNIDNFQQQPQPTPNPTTPGYQSVQTSVGIQSVQTGTGYQAVQTGTGIQSVQTGNTSTIIGGTGFLPPAPTPGIRIANIIGTVNIVDKDGKIIRTLKPGDVIPENLDNTVTFSVVEGSMEVQSNGKTVTATTGSNFTVSNINNEVKITVTAGAPVAIKSESGSNVVITANSTVKLLNVAGEVKVEVEKGLVVVSDSAGGGSKSVKAGETASIPAVTTPVIVSDGGTPRIVATPVPVPDTTVVETKTVEEGKKVSGSNP